MLFSTLALLLALPVSQEVKQALQARDYVRAESLLLQDLKKTPDSAPLLATIGGVQFQAGHFQRAVESFEKANRLQTLDNANRFTLVMAYATLNQRDHAREHLLALPETAITVYWRGRLDFADANYRSAISLFERAIKLDANFMRAYDSLGLAHEAASDPAEAIKYYRLAIELNKECSPWPTHNLGALLIKLERLDDADPVLQSSLSCSPEFAPGLYQLGRLREKQGRSSDAIAALRTALEKDPQNADAWFVLARIYGRTGDTAKRREAFKSLARLHQNGAATDSSALLKAVQAYQAAVQLDPSDADATYQLALLLAIKGDYQESLKQIGKLKGAQQQRPQALAVRLACQRALGQEAANVTLKTLAEHKNLTERDVLDILPALVRSKQHDLSIRLLETLQSRGMAGAGCLEALAEAYEQSGRPAEARKTVEELVSRSGASADLLLQLARNAYQQADYIGTLSYLAHARDLDPTSAAIQFFFGMTAIALDLPLEAKRALAEAVQLAPYNPYHHYAYGAVLAQERDASLSIPYFERYCLLRPHDIRGRFALAVAQFLSGRTEESQASLAELTRSSETSAGAHYFLGRIAKQQNRLEDAERELKLSLELLPTQLDVRSELGQVYMRLRRYDLAEMNLQEVLKEDPMHYFANVNLLALYQRTNHPDSAAQAERLERVKKVRSEKEQALWRTIEVRPY